MEDWTHTIVVDKSNSAAHVLVVFAIVARNYGAVKVVSRRNGNALRIALHKDNSFLRLLFLFAREKPQPGSDKTVVELRVENALRRGRLLALVLLGVILAWTIVMPLLVIAALGIAYSDADKLVKEICEETQRRIMGREGPKAPEAPEAPSPVALSWH